MAASAGVGLFSMVAVLVVVPFILAAVSAAQYGVWLVLSSTALLMYYTDFGVGSAIIHFSSRRRGGGEKYSLGELLSAGLLWNLLASFLAIPAYLIFAAVYLSQHAAEAGIGEDAQLALLVCGGATMAVVLIRPFGSALVGSGFLPLERRNQGVAVIFRLLATLAVCWLFPSIEMIAVVDAIAYALPPAISAVNILGLGHHEIRWRRSTFATMKYMLGYSGRAFVYSLIDAILLQGGTIAAGTLATPADATYFNLAFRIFSSVRQLQRWITEPLRPAMSRLYSMDKVGAESILFALSRVLFVGTSFGCIILMLLGPIIVDLWIGGDAPVELIASTSAILMGGLILSTIHIPFAIAAYSAGQPTALLGPQIVWLACFVALVAPMEKFFGTQGIALALTLPLFVVEPLCSYMASKRLGINISGWVSSEIAPSLYLLLSGAVAASVYIVAAGGVLATYLSPLWLTLAFTAGVGLGAISRPRALPIDSLRAIFRTEL